MPTSHDVEAEVRATVLALFETWRMMGVEATDASLAHFADDFTGLGTGPGDYYPDREAVRTLFVREKEDMTYTSTLDILWMTVRLLHPTLALVEGQMRSEIYLESETHVVEPRFSFVLANRNQRWLAVHFHFSFSDARQEEGGTLMDVLEGRNRELEREVARRTAELNQSLADLKAAQARLVQQEKLASLGQLTAGIAHEIKNPLNFINNFAALSRELLDELDAETDPAEQQALLDDLKINAERIEAHGRRADGIVHAMLDHARPNSHERRLVDFNTLVGEYVALALHGKKAQSPDVEVAVVENFDASVGELEIGPQEIGRVVLNLMSNALDAVLEHATQAEEPYTPRISVTTQRTAEAVTLRIADNGPGIPEASHGKIFEPFYTTKPPGSGTGLGLSLSYDIIIQGHGGTLTVDSLEGQGATFMVTLPLDKKGT